MHTNQYTLLYATTLSVITAVVLAIAAEGLKPAQEANIALDTKANILKAVRLDLPERAQIEKTFNENVKAMVLNANGEVLEGINATDIDLKAESEKPPAQRNLPLYIYTSTNAQSYYILPVRGKGLWGPIWGYVSLENDFNTVYGAFFDHKSETPGLGAEIAEKPFQQQFQGKKIKDEKGGLVSVRVVKKTDKVDFGKQHRVDAISGGTITSRGTDEMLRVGFESYLPYFQKVQQLNNSITQN
ncbi:MAG: NADH:ubiquinone reductase (Na(+)-transporting) subunit C [Runella sp.]